MKVAEIILRQLGGSKFLAMTGAKDMVYDTKSISFSLPRGFAKNGINKVKITLDVSDTYTIRFMKWNARKLEVTDVAIVNDVYVESLREVFTNHTGLDCAL